MTREASDRSSINWQKWAVIVSVFALIVTTIGVTANQHWWPFTRSGVAVAHTNEHAREEQEERERERREHEQRKKEEEGRGPQLSWLSDIRNPNRDNFGDVRDLPVTVGGQTYAHTVQLVDANSNCGQPTDPAYVSFPVPSGATHLSGMFGWTPDSNGSAAELTVYADSTTGKLLWSQSFSNPGLPLLFKRFDNIAGARAVIFELAGQQCDNGTFLLAETQFSS